MKKLLKGMTFANYKKLCEYLEWNDMGGSTKDKNLKELNRLCTWERDGFKYIITSSAPKDAEDKKRVGSRSVYLQPLEVVVMNYLQKICKNLNDGILVTGKLEMLENIGLIDDSLRQIFRNDYKPPTNLIDTDSKAFRTFKQEVLTSMQTKLMSCLNSMCKRGLIQFAEVDVIRFIDGSNRVATAEESNKLARIKHKVLEDMGYRNLGVVNFLGKIREYKELFELELENFNLDYIVNHASALKIALVGGLTPYPYVSAEEVQLSLYKLSDLFKALLQKRCTNIINNDLKFKDQLIQQRTEEQVIEKIKEELKIMSLDEADATEIDRLYSLYYAAEKNNNSNFYSRFLDTVDADIWDILINSYFLSTEEVEDTKNKLKEKCSYRFLKYIRY